MGRAAVYKKQKFVFMEYVSLSFEKTQCRINLQNSEIDLMRLSENMWKPNISTVTDVPRGAHAIISAPPERNTQICTFGKPRLCQTRRAEQPRVQPTFVLQSAFSDCAEGKNIAGPRSEHSSTRTAQPYFSRGL